MNQSRLKEILKEKGIKQRELIEMAGLSEPNISRYVNQQRIPSVYNAVKIAKALTMAVEDIFLIK
jgi:transcriptional regulator with XRE-family HTH domain